MRRKGDELLATDLAVYAVMLHMSSDSRPEAKLIGTNSAVSNAALNVTIH